MVIQVKNSISQIHTGGKDNLYCNVIQEVRDFLSVKIPNLFYRRQRNKFAPEYKYFCTPGGKFPTGFLTFVIDFIRANTDLPDELIEIRDERTNLLEFNENLVLSVGDATLYDYQTNILKQCNRSLDGFYFPRGIIDAATNAGKNYLIAALHNNLPGQSLMLIHNKEIFEQMYEFMSEIEEVGLIGTYKGKRRMELDKPFTIAMAKTLYNRVSDDTSMKRWLQSIPTLFVDESHRAGSREYMQLVNWTDAGQRYFVSGTPLSMDDPVTKMLMIGLAGPVIARIPNEFLIENGYSYRPEIHVYASDLQPCMEADYESLYRTNVMANPSRLNIMLQYLTNNPERATLISVSRTEHGEMLYNYISTMFDARWVHSGTPTRTEDIDDFKDGVYPILITTLLQEGVNAGIDTLIYANGGKAEIKLKQYIGRILRKKGNHEVVHVIDFFDRPTALAKHSRKRLHIYEKEKFDIIYHYEHNRFGSPI